VPQGGFARLAPDSGPKADNILATKTARFAGDEFEKIMNTAEKVLSALALFTLENPEWTVEAAAEQLDVSTSTAYRYFKSLTTHGFLSSISGGRYILGPAIIALDWQLKFQDPLIRVARPVMEKLVKRSGSDCVSLLCRRFRHQVMCVHQAYEHEPEHAVSYERGRPMGMYRGAASRIILANLPNRIVKRLWETDSQELIDAGLGSSWPEFREQLRKIRAAGVSITRGQVDPGMVGIAAPIWEPGSQIPGSVSLVVPEAAVSASDIAGHAALVEAAAREIDVAISELSPADIVTSTPRGVRPSRASKNLKRPLSRGHQAA
jgi:DNA-binding IclR family transcriptional regulator